MERDFAQFDKGRNKMTTYIKPFLIYDVSDSKSKLL